MRGHIAIYLAVWRRESGIVSWGVELKEIDAYTSILGLVPKKDIRLGENIWICAWI